MIARIWNTSAVRPVTGARFVVTDRHQTYFGVNSVANIVVRFRVFFFFVIVPSFPLLDGINSKMNVID